MVDTLISEFSATQPRLTTEPPVRPGGGQSAAVEPGRLTGLLGKGSLGSAHRPVPKLSGSGSGPRRLLLSLRREAEVGAGVARALVAPAPAPTWRPHLAEGE